MNDPSMENVQDSFTEEIDAHGGWLITHHVQTWDTRVPLTSLQQTLAEAEIVVEKSIERRDAIKAKIDDAATKTAIEAAKEAEVTP